jgi:hypothetical protein
MINKIKESIKKSTDFDLKEKNRLLAGLDEIEVFEKENLRLPEKYAGSIIEHQLACRLETMKSYLN